MADALAKLPRYVYAQRVKGHTYYRFRRGGVHARLPAIDSPDFMAAYDRLALEGVSSQKGYANEAVTRYLIGDALPRTKRRAKECGIPFDLTAEYIMAILERQGHRCAVSGIAFDLGRTGARAVKTRLPFRPSIDRIVPAKGYTPGNVRVLCFAVNMGMADWGDDVFLEVCRAVVKSARAESTAYGREC